MKEYRVWQLIDTATLLNLERYQLKTYGQHITLRYFKDESYTLDSKLEDLSEIARLMQEPTHWERQPR